MEEILKKILTKVEKIDSQQKENTSILKALEHKVEVHKAELDKLNINVAKLIGQVKGVRMDINIVQIDVAKNSLDVALIKQEKINEA